MDPIEGYEQWYELLDCLEDEFNRWFKPQLFVLYGSAHYPTISLPDITDFDAREFESRNRRDREQLRDTTTPEVWDEDMPFDAKRVFQGTGVTFELCQQNAKREGCYKGDACDFKRAHDMKAEDVRGKEYPQANWAKKPRMRYNTVKTKWYAYGKGKAEKGESKGEGMGKGKKGRQSEEERGQPIERRGGVGRAPSVTAINPGTRVERPRPELRPRGQLPRQIGCGQKAAGTSYENDQAVPQQLRTYFNIALNENHVDRGMFQNKEWQEHEEVLKRDGTSYHEPKSEFQHEALVTYAVARVCQCSDIEDTHGMPELMSVNLDALPLGREDEKVRESVEYIPDEPQYGRFAKTYDKKRYDEGVAAEKARSDLSTRDNWNSGLNLRRGTGKGVAWADVKDKRETSYDDDSVALVEAQLRAKRLELETLRMEVEVQNKRSRSRCRSTGPNDRERDMDRVTGGASPSTGARTTLSDTQIGNWRAAWAASSSAVTRTHEVHMLNASGPAVNIHLLGGKEMVSMQALRETDMIRTLRVINVLRHRELRCYRN
jgi:hypothetical protein